MSVFLVECWFRFVVSKAENRELAFGQSGQRADKCTYGIRCEAAGAFPVLWGSVCFYADRCSTGANGKWRGAKG